VIRQNTEEEVAKEEILQEIEQHGAELLNKLAIEDPKAKIYQLDRSARVKSVEFYPSEEKPWVLSALHNGKVQIWDYETNVVIKRFEVSELPVRSAKFIVSKDWIVVGGDDKFLHVFDIDTLEEVKQWEAHLDYIRCIDVHSQRSHILSSSDDKTIKLWDWSKEFQLLQTFTGHSHYVMMVKFNPIEMDTFASGSLDGTIKVWDVTTPEPLASLEGEQGHKKGVNCIEYHRDSHLLLSGADDHTVKVWDYKNKSCLTTLEGHTSNLSAVCFHPQLPLIISGSEDPRVRTWHSTTYASESVIDCGLERVWTLAVNGSTKFAVGCDEGTAIVALE